VTFIVSKSGFLASGDENSPGVGKLEIPVGQRLVVLLKQHDPDKVRFSWNNKHWWALENLFRKYSTPEGGRDHL
jgi:hypothetical protein